MSEQEPTWAEAFSRVREALDRNDTPQAKIEYAQRMKDAFDIHTSECHRIREAMPTTHEESRSMGYWGNEVLEKHRQCCALQSWYDPKKRMYRWFRPQDGWRRP